MTSESPATGDEYPRPADRPHAPTTGGINAPIAGRVRMPDLVGRLVALCPLSVEWLTVTMNGRQQESEATIVHVLEIDERGGCIDHGEHPVFWRYVRKQLDDLATVECPWVVGTVVKLTRAYSISAPTLSQRDAALTALDGWRANGARS